MSTQAQSTETGGEAPFSLAAPTPELRGSRRRRCHLGKASEIWAAVEALSAASRSADQRFSIPRPERRPCAQFAQHGSCPLGDQCTHSHLDPGHALENRPLSRTSLEWQRRPKVLLHKLRDRKVGRGSESLLTRTLFTGGFELLQHGEMCEVSDVLEKQERTRQDGKSLSMKATETTMATTMQQQELHQRQQLEPQPQLEPQQQAQLWPLADLLLCNAFPSRRIRSKLRPGCFVNHFPGEQEMGAKDRLARLLRGRSFLPETWVLPEEHRSLRTVLMQDCQDCREPARGEAQPEEQHEHKQAQGQEQEQEHEQEQEQAQEEHAQEDRLWIYKPAQLGEGRHVEVYTSSALLASRLLLLPGSTAGRSCAARARASFASGGLSPGIVSQYIPNPLLIEGRKVDFRVYVFIRQVEPELEAYLFREGLVKQCGSRYDVSEEGLKNTSAHVSNNAVQTKGIHNAAGRNWSFSQFWTLLRQQQAKEGQERESREFSTVVWARICRVVRETLEAWRRSLRSRPRGPRGPLGPRSEVYKEVDKTTHSTRKQKMKEKHEIAQHDEEEQEIDEEENEEGEEEDEALEDDAEQEDGRLKSFSLLAVDLLVDQSGKVWLLEINPKPALHAQNPSMKVVFPVHYAVKGQLLADMFSALGLPERSGGPPSTLLQPFTRTSIGGEVEEPQEDPSGQGAQASNHGLLGFDKLETLPVASALAVTLLDLRPVRSRIDGFLEAKEQHHLACSVALSGGKPFAAVRQH